MMESDHKINLTQSYNNKNQPSTLPGSPLEKELIDELNKLESNFAKMEIQYMKKIKEMKNHLGQRSKKNQMLNNQLISLKNQFHDHEQQIKVLMKDFQVQEEQNIRKSNPKLNNSPGIIQKSLQSIRRTERPLLYKPLLKNSVKVVDNSMNISTALYPQQKKIINKKAYSPTYTNQNKTISIAPQKLKRQKQMRQMQAKKQQQIQMLKQKQKQKQRQRQRQKQKQKQIKREKIIEQIKVTSSEKNIIESQGLPYKSKKELNQFLCASLKNVTNKQNKEIKTSPKRIIKRSPNNISSTTNTKRQDKMKLGNVKQELVEIF